MFITDLTDIQAGEAASNRLLPTSIIGSSIDHHIGPIISDSLAIHSKFHFVIKVTELWNLSQKRTYYQLSILPILACMFEFELKLFGV